MNVFSFPPPPLAAPAQGVAQAELRAMLAEMKAQRLEEQVAALNAHATNLQKELDGKNRLLSLLSFGSHWNITSLPGHGLQEVPEVAASEDFPDLGSMQFSAAVQHILGTSEQAGTPSLPSSDESNVVTNAKRPNNRRRRQQRKARGQGAKDGLPPFVDAEVLERREKQLKKAKEHIVYQRYVAEVARPERKPCDPQTPNKNHSYFRRDFDTRVKNWKKSLYRWDERIDEEAALAEGVSAVANFKPFEDFELFSYNL